MLYLRFRPSMLTNQYLRDLEEVRNELDPYARLPEEYAVELRRHALAETIHYSTAIEGNTLTLEQVQSLLAGGRVSAPQDQVQEVENYREALAYFPSLTADSNARITEETVRHIHFLITKSLPGEYAPGLYRTKQNYIVDRISNRRLFLPPAPEDVPKLMREFVEWLNQENDLPATYKAALAHLNLVAIHPFLDGNGRTARVLDSLVVYRGGFRSQYLVSLEAYFGRDNQGYYNALATALGPYYTPERDVIFWVDYYLQAHVAQARAATKYSRELVAELDGMNEAFQAEDLTVNQIGILWYACRFGRISNREYRDLTGRSHQSAVVDFSKLIAKGFLVRFGRSRSIVYAPSQKTGGTFEKIRLQLGDE